MQEHQLTLDRHTFFYREQGNGPALILLHGFGEDGSVWVNQFDAFKGYRLLVPDLPGSGKSALPEHMSMESLADTIHEWMDVAAIEDAVMIGHSMGGYIALAFAEKYPERLNGLGLFHSTAFADNTEKLETRQKGIAFIKQYGAQPFLETMIPNLFGPFAKEQKPEIISRQIALAHNFSAAALVSYYQSMMQRPERTNVLKESKVPVLIVASKSDKLIPLEESLQQAYMPQLSYIHVLKCSGHMGMLEESEETNRHIIKFLQTIEIYTITP
jgi:pimeloyl-ACP methyl ester carboxylesterase